MGERMKLSKPPHLPPIICPALPCVKLLPRVSFLGGSERRGSRLGAHSLNGPAARAGPTSG